MVNGVTLSAENHLSEISDYLQKIAVDLAAHRATTETKLAGVVERLDKQNGRVGKLEDRMGQSEVKHAEQKGRQAVMSAALGFGGGLVMALLSVLFRAWVK